MSVRVGEGDDEGEDEDDEKKKGLSQLGRGGALI